MSTRRAKQMLYGVFYGVVWILILAAVYVIVRPASAPAAPPCTTDCPPSGAHPLTAIGKVYLFTTSPGHLTFLTEVKNSNASFAATNFNYEIDLYDGTGKVIGSVPGQSFVYSSQIKYLVVPNVAVAGVVDHAELTVKDTAWVPASALGVVPSFAFENLSSNVTDATVAVSGEITNNDIDSFPRIIVIAIFDGPGGGPIGASATEVDNLDAGATTDFSVIYPAVFGLDPANSQIFAYALRK